MIRIKPLSISIAIPLAVGGLAGFLTRNAFKDYNTTIIQPDFAPPGWLFPVVWTVLYVLMGVSCYIVWESRSPLRSEALKIYTAQLAVNFVWPLLFFLLKGFLISFLWLLLLVAMVASMIYTFWKIKPIAGGLQIPYLGWCCFASLLNWSVYLLNR